jgi:arylsulfatase A-like enzyme
MNQEIKTDTHKYSRREFLTMVGAGASALALGSLLNCRSSAPERLPNILFILADDLGYGDLSSYGATDLQTPNIDKLMAEGMRFDNFYANSPVCSPTRASIMTGRYPDLVGVPGVIRTQRSDNWGNMSPQAVLLPKLLKSAGYETALIGKWHLGLESPNTPNERGFDHFHGFLGDMMESYYTHRREGQNYMRLNEEVIDPQGHATDLFTQWSADYVKEHSNSDKPFFLFLSYNAPHTPIQPPDDWTQKVRTRESGIDIKRARLAAHIEYMDDGIGKVLATLKESGLSDNTLVVFTSDNGGQSNVGANNGPLKGTKGGMYEGGLKIPMCAVWPGKIKPGSTNNGVAMTMDLFPTFCEAAGAKIEHEIDGRSILPILLGQTQSMENRVLFWMRREGNIFGGQVFYAARIGDFKLLQNTPFEPLELYNLKDDPMEENPLGDRNNMYQRLFTALHDHINQAGLVPWQREK